jgi:DNA-binding NarL/FixJ family response regulator
MRVSLVGSPAERARLRAGLRAAGIEVVEEFDTLADAQAAGAPHPLVVADDESHVDHHDAGDGTYEEKLTPRELDVLELLTEGLSNKFIAERLGISDQTVKFHIAQILGKLGAANRTDAVRRALRRGLIGL